MAKFRIHGPQGRLAVEDGGVGYPTLCFLSSEEGDLTEWFSELEEARKKNRAVSLDLRGHGKSDPPADGDYAIEAKADDIGAAVEELRLAPMVLIGHGRGAVVAVEYGLREFHFVQGLLLVNPVFEADPEAQEKMNLYHGPLIVVEDKSVFSEALDDLISQVRARLPRLESHEVEI